MKKFVRVRGSSLSGACRTPGIRARGLRKARRRRLS